MMDVVFGDIIEGRLIIADHIMREKSNGSFKVIDVGGTDTSWSSNLIDALVDVKSSDESKLQFIMDICRQDSWKKITDFVEENGKFDFCICSHTLEDIYNPYLVLDNLPKIAKSGVISMPSIKMEINLVENLNWSGFLHHRYLFGHRNGKIVIAPKLPVIEKISNKTQFDRTEEIRFWWKDTIDYEIFMDNYLGPDSSTVLENLEVFLKEQTR